MADIFDIMSFIVLLLLALFFIFCAMYPYTTEKRRKIFSSFRSKHIQNLENIHWKYDHQLHIWFCKNLGWHIVSDKKWFDGASYHSICIWCGKECLKDSQDNWF